MHDSHDFLVARLAARQHGVVSAAQLREAGLGRGAIHHRVLQGRLHRCHRGVYAVGHGRLTWQGRLWAAVLACGGADAAAVSHRSAAAFWDLLPVPAGAIDVTTLARCESHEGIRVHRRCNAEVVHDDEGLPLTSLTCTLVDLAAELAAHQLQRACRRAELVRRLDAAAVEAQAAGRHGAPKLRAVLAALHPVEPEITRSELEERFLALVHRAALPRPLVNAQVGGHEVDFFWPAARLIAETDGAAAHMTPTAFERDRERDAALMLGGYRVVRFTWRQVVDGSDRVAATLRALTGSSSD